MVVVLLGECVFFVVIVGYLFVWEDVLYLFGWQNVFD